MDPTFSTPWDSFVLVLPKFDIDGVDGVFISNQDDLQQEEVANNEGGQKGGQKGGQNEEKTVDIILQLIKQNPYVTRKELSESVGIAPSAIQKHINKLKDNGTIVRHGGDRGGHWEVLKQQ